MAEKRAIITSVCVIMIALFLFFTGSLSAEEADAPVNDEFLSIGAERFLLDNGLNVILKRDSRTPTVAVTLLVNAGSATEGTYTGSGTTHFIEHMMFKGTTSYTAVQLENKLKSLGAETGAFTSYDYTCFKVQAPAASLGEILHIITDMVENPAFLKEEFQHEKEVILREIDMGDDDPEKYLYKLFQQTAYIQHPYKNPVIGYKEVFKRLELSDLTSYYNEFYIPNNMILSIAGDIEPSLALQDVKQTLGTLNRERFTPPVVSAEPEQISSREFFENFSVSRPRALIGFHAVAVNHPDLYSLDTLAIILGGGLTSRLYETLHDDKGLVHSIGSYNYTPRHPGFFVISFVAKQKSVKETIEVVKEEIKKIKQSPPKEMELKRAKTKVLSSYLLGLETQQNKADTLAANFALTGDLDFSGKYVKGIENVTADDITEAASKYLTEENMTIAGLVPGGYEEEKGIEHALIEEAEKPQTIKKVLPNGLAVVMTENHTNPVCSIIVSIKGGLRAEDAKCNGISNLAVSTMPKGTSRYKKDQLTDLIESLGVQFTPYSGNNSFGFIINFMSKDTEKVIDLLAHILLHPTFSEEEVNIVKTDVLAGIELIRDDIFKYTNLSLRKSLFQKHPYRLISIGSKESVSGISKADLIDFHKKFCVAKNTVISICGNIDEENVFKILEDKFENMPEGEIFQVEQMKIDTRPRSRKISEHMDKRQAVVMIGFKGASLYDEDRYPLQVLSSLFSGGSGRLYSQIRQKEGLAYTLGTFGMVGLDTGAFIFYAATTPQNANNVKTSIISQIRQISAGKITEEEINAAKKSLITKYQLSIQSNGGLALQTGLDELYGLGYDYHVHYPDVINSISKKDLIIAAKKYFKLNKSVTVVTTPK
ncbi:MAG: insulinase family protein [Candidatus Omnitrophota bacterium]|nr:MAG: insulinase family protein [Candidatus Omnitrophota bacterium]